MRRKSKPFASKPEKLANIRGFHSYSRPDGYVDVSLETQIERAIESPGIPLIRSLASGKVRLNFEQRLQVARLVALQSVRVPYERLFLDRNIDNLRSPANRQRKFENLTCSYRILNAPVSGDRPLSIGRKEIGLGSLPGVESLDDIGLPEPYGGLFAQ